MSSKLECLCTICICGKHKCPHNPRGTLRPDQPCGFTEYHDEYQPHLLTGREKDFRPEHKPISSEHPIDSATTHKTDYVPHELGPHYVHKADPYEKPQGEMDDMTNYRQHYTPKNQERVQPIRREEQKRIPAKFEGLPTYKDDYRRWNGEPVKRFGPDNTYQPSDSKFLDRTNYKDDYIPYSVAKQQAILPQSNSNQSKDPFADDTDYKSSYIRHELPKKTVKEKEQWQQNPTKLDDLTNYRMDYVPRDWSKTESCKPANRPYESDARFDDMTTHKTDYQPKELERRYQREREQYHPSEHPMDGLTTHKQDYTHKGGSRPQAIRPAESKRIPGKFDSSTQYKTDYLNFGNVERSMPKPREGYQPNDARFDGQPTYKSDYIPYQNYGPRSSLKPMETGVRSDQPLDSDTEYKYSYQPKFLPPCPSDALISGRGQTGYTFKQQDELGHKWYEIATRS